MVNNGISGSIWWFGWLENSNGHNEGQRAFDLSAGVLFPYLHGSDVRLCPSPVWDSPQFKPKGTNVIFSYGYNKYLSPLKTNELANISRVSQPTDTALFADAAQVNTFQTQNSPYPTMFEEWYYVCLNDLPNGHFRHSNKANVAFCDGHIGSEKMDAGSHDQRMPSANIGRLRPETLLIH